jgi:hypothetical protein
MDMDDFPHSVLDGRSTVAWSPAMAVTPDQLHEAAVTLEQHGYAEVVDTHGSSVVFVLPDMSGEPDHSSA